jgi:hypothetical protein
LVTGLLVLGLAQGDAVGKAVPNLVTPREEGLAGGGATEDQIARAWDALAVGETHRAVSRLREAHRAEPGHPTTARLVEVLNRLERPCEEVELSESLRRVLPEGSRLERSDHVALWHQGTPESARERLEVLERVVLTFYLVFTASGFDLDVPRQRLPFLWLADHRAYVEFLRVEGAEPFLSTTGFYHPTRRMVVTYDVARASEAPGFAARFAGIDPRAVAVGTATHELVHQLMSVSGLVDSSEDFPRWLHEGLAMQFEAAPEGSWAGFGRVHHIRLADWERAARSHRLLPVIRDEGLERGYQRGRYAEAWALVYFLRQRHPRQFVALLDLLRVPRRRPGPPADHYERVFRQALGPDLNRLEREWVEFIERLEPPTPSRPAEAACPD